ncbi:inositol monophosphatase family protein [Helicobacter trogontum]|uniref:Inositol monophosphatase n=1 Tax=Helicobacter trogontum TaxID=50960 RepID=A0A4U8TGJ2_9HELI|nr:inositol monophosphatase family protein [Helicobacter trogontum]MDY5184519.1 inositol monophosphatase family protein [Helicobacter trogontum]TLD99173.1 hypothetical protein LS80_001790 [Helicobacter trogontum]
MNNLSLDTLLPLLQRDFFMRIVLASVEVIRLLHTQDSILHESFGVGAGGDRSSGADLLAETIFCKFLLPHYHIDSEESGLLKGGSNVKGTIVLDPLDGSSNFKSNIPYFGASVALCDATGKVCEACVVNYISCEIAYLNDDLLALTKMPCIFSLQTFIADLQPEYLIYARTAKKPTSMQPYYMPCNFTKLLQNSNTTIKSVFMTNACNAIRESAQYLPTFDANFLHAMFASQILIYRPQKVIAEKLECGIFEKAMQYTRWASFLAESGLKFRSLGAIALSLAFSFRYLFVLLPMQVRKYDGMAGFYLAQNQVIYGNLECYYEAIPSLRQCKEVISHILITTDSHIVDKFKGR